MLWFSLVSKSRYHVCSSFRLHHIDDNPTGGGAEQADFGKALQPTEDPICCIAASDKVLVVVSILEYEDLCKTRVIQGSSCPEKFSKFTNRVIFLA
jgi:hypothetical protein